jgi:prolyl 4-hydroxylase
MTVPKQYKDMVVNPLGDRQRFYDDFINGCVKANGIQGGRCRSTEADRFEMSLRQPQSMQNYTKVGFKKIKAPEALFKLIQNFWHANKEKATEEQWGVGNTYTNNWMSKSYMVSVEDTNLRGGGWDLKQKIWEAARDVIGEWTGQELTQCSLYGIRIYKDGALLAPHVDRLPLVSSAIINVDQDVDEPWPLEVYGHDGKATNVTMEPGDMVLYESHSVIHGRPFPLKGRYMANLFVHFEPTGHSLRHHAKMEDLDLDQDVNAKYRESLMKKHSGHENSQGDLDLPTYIVQGTPEASHWHQTHPTGQKSKQKSFTTGSTTAHTLAREGSVAQLEREIQRKKSLVNSKDENGWTPLHEGIRSGHVEVVRLLVENGADVNATTYGNGGNALWWAKQTHQDDHPIIQFLESIGATSVGPEL